LRSEREKEENHFARKKGGGKVPEKGKKRGGYTRILCEEREKKQSI